MASQMLEYGLVAALALGFVAAAICDWRTRTIPHAITVPMALAAPLYWFAQGMPVWPDMAVALGAALAVFLIFMIPFAIGQMGGGDLKLIGAAALWFPLFELSRFVIGMALVGAALTIIVAGHHYWRRKPGKPWTPYGIAISAAGLWVIYERYFNHFG